MKLFEERSPIHSAAVIEVIHIRVNRGTGAQDDPVRTIDQFWTTDGSLLAEQDDHMAQATYVCKMPKQESGAEP